MAALKVSYVSNVAGRLIDGAQVLAIGGIDGFSRLIVFLDCATDNTAATVLCRFHTAVRRYCLPSRIRCDKGGENTQVALYILEHPRRGPGRGSIIAGRSIHNQRIERLWRDVFQGVLKLYYGLFYHLESIGVLDPNSDIHLFCIHYVYLPRIRHCLAVWKDAWNMHPMRTENNHTPLQLWTRGLLARSSQDYRDMNDELVDEVRIFVLCNQLYLYYIRVASPVDDHKHFLYFSLFQALFSTYGVDWEGPPPSDDSDNSDVVAVPQTSCPLSPPQLAELHALYDSLSPTDDFAVNMHLNVLHFVQNQTH